MVAQVATGLPDLKPMQASSSLVQAVLHTRRHYTHYEEPSFGLRISAATFVFKKNCKLFILHVIMVYTKVPSVEPNADIRFVSVL